MEIIAFYDFVIDNQKKAILMKNKKDYSFLMKFAQIIWTIYGLINFYYYYKTGETFKLISGFIGLLWFVIFLLDFKKTYITKINFNTINSIEYKRQFLENVLIIKLKNSKKRFIKIEINKEKMIMVENILMENSICFINKTT